ncbi:hypothetical protein J6590_008628 [Homalodisca vitripennis]|nr:hypothetical protein J6590_008628 [Homalodisca vitripennis]
MRIKLHLYQLKELIESTYVPAAWKVIHSVGTDTDCVLVGRSEMSVTAGLYCSVENALETVKLKRSKWILIAPFSIPLTNNNRGDYVQAMMLGTASSDHTLLVIEKERFLISRSLQRHLRMLLTRQDHAIPDRTVLPEAHRRVKRGVGGCDPPTASLQIFKSKHKTRDLHFFLMTIPPATVGFDKYIIQAMSFPHYPPLRREKQRVMAMNRK